MEMFTEIIAWASWGFGMLIIGGSTMIFYIYLRHKHKYFKHIILMAGSYIILSALMIATINYRIFYDGASRFVGAIALLVAFIMGVVGLWKIIGRKASDVVHRTEA